MKLDNVQRNRIMLTNPISSNLPTLPALFTPPTDQARRGGGDRDSSDANSQSITVLASLLEALVQAASTPAAATSSSAGVTATAGASAATGASTATGAAPSASTGATSTPTSVTSAAGSTSTGTATTGSTSTSSLVSDLQSFLHDLFSALRQAGRSGHGGREHEHWRERVPAASTTAAAPATSTAPSTPGGTPIPATTAPSSTAPSTAAATTAAGSATSTAPATTSVGTPVANAGIGAYGQRGIIAELNALVQDLSGTSSASGVSPRVLSNLNSAFEKLISDLKGTSSAASTSSATSTSNASSASPAVGTAPSPAAATSDQSTTALQLFLTNFAQDLKNNGANSFSPLGSSVNTTA
jgi:hypothetical protein